MKQQFPVISIDLRSLTATRTGRTQFTAGRHTRSHTKSSYFKHNVRKLSQKTFTASR